MALAAAPFAAQAETINIYGWQNHSWEFVDEQNGSGTDRSYDRMNSNAGNIGFAASVDTGMDGIHVNFQCEQFTFFNQFAEHWRAGEAAEYASSSTWCNRNSKIGLSHPQAGEIMLATWLLPYNEGVAQWVDPFYDAGADSHTNIMGSVGATSSTFYNPVFGRSVGFNRRQENIIQYWSPNWNGFVFRFAWTVGNNDETKALNDHEIDPVIRSSSLAYTNGPLWLAVTWQDHEDWSAHHMKKTMESSDAESVRVAGRYIMDMGDGVSIQLSAMWENLEYEFNGVTSVDAAMDAFGYGNFASSYKLYDGNDPIEAVMRQTVNRSTHQVVANAVLADVWEDALTARDGETALTDTDLPPSLWYTTAADGTVTWTATDQSSDNTYTQVDRVLVKAMAAVSAADNDDPLTQAAEPEVVAVAGNENNFNPSKYLAGLQAVADLDATDDADEARYEAFIAKANRLAMAEADSQTETAYMAAKTEADKAYMMAIEDFLPDNYDDLMGEKKTDAEKAAANLAGRKDQAGNVTIERDAWLVSGKIKFGGPLDFRFSYADADDLEISCNACSGDWNESGGDAWNVGLFYTMPAGTELRLTYSEVNSDDNVGYGQSIPGTGVGAAGNEIEMFAVGIVHWFD